MLKVFFQYLKETIYFEESKKIGSIQILRNNEYKVLTNLDENQLESALYQFEDMISKGRSLMEKDQNLMNPLEPSSSIESQSKTSSINLIKEPSEEKNNNITIEIDDRPIFQYDTFGDFYDQISDDEDWKQEKNEVLIRKEDQFPSKSEISEELEVHVVVEEDSQQYIDTEDLDNIKIDVIDMMEEPANKPESNCENEHIIETTAQSSPQENKNLGHAESKHSAAKSKKPAVQLEGPVLRPKRIQNFLSMVKKERKPKPEPKEKHLKKAESLSISGKKSKQSALAPASGAEVSDLQPKPVYSDEYDKL